MKYRIKVQGREYVAYMVGSGLNKIMLVGCYEVASEKCWFHASTIPSYTKIAGVYS